MFHFGHTVVMLFISGALLPPCGNIKLLQDEYLEMNEDELQENLDSAGFVT